MLCFVTQTDVLLFRSSTVWEFECLVKLFIWTLIEMLHQEYKVITLNGLNNPIKRSKAIAKMKREKQDNLLARDASHKHRTWKTTQNGVQKLILFLIWEGKCKACGSTNFRVNFQFSWQITEKEGCYLLIKESTENREITLLNVYRPAGNYRQLIKKYLIWWVQKHQVCWYVEGTLTLIYILF